jgi:hypothetical protein
MGRYFLSIIFLSFIAVGLLGYFSGAGLRFLLFVGVGIVYWVILFLRRPRRKIISQQENGCTNGEEKRTKREARGP